MILAYHEIVGQDAPYAYAVSRRRLEEHLEALEDLRKRRPALVSGLRLTFDDGHESQHRNAIRALACYPALRAVFFIVPGWVGARTGYMNWPQVRELAAMGHEIQSHSWSHPFLARCSGEKLRLELARSKDVLEQTLGTAVDAISVPGGSWNRTVLAACAAAGYKDVYISDPWFGEKHREGVRVIGRLMVRRTMTAGKLASLLEAERRTFSLPKVPYRLRQAARQVLGEGLYHRLWCIAARREEIASSYSDPA